MEWFRFEADLPDHPKLARLATRLGVAKDAAFARLGYLWCWVARYRETGDLTGLTPAEVAEAARWKGDPVRLLDALTDAGFLDRDGQSMQVHDWIERNGKPLRDRERMAEARSRTVREPCAHGSGYVRTNVTNERTNTRAPARGHSRSELVALADHYRQSKAPDAQSMLRWAEHAIEELDREGVTG